jgi:glycerate-2-kinase
LITPRTAIVPSTYAGRDALAIYADVLRAVDAGMLVARNMSVEQDALLVGGQRFPLCDVHRVLVLGAGKAATAMAQAAERILGPLLRGGVVVTKHGHGGPTERVRIMEAGHPVPDETSVEAGAAIAEAARDAGPGDLVIVLISGGASALMELPQGDITLDDIQETTTALLRCGADITELNSVRACVSRLKAGGLARLIAPAKAVCLVLSDVLGNPLEAIGSGPCVLGSGACHRALRVLQKYGLAGTVPASVLEAAEQAASAETSGSGMEPVPHVIVGDIRTALDAASVSAERLGYHPIVVTGLMRGEAREVALTLAGAARDLPILKGRSGLDCLIFGGETTVTVHGDGLGGRCQEIAAAAIPVLAGVENVALLAAGTDGTDGPTDAAGALVEGSTARRVAAAGLSVAESLAQNDTYPLLDRTGALIRTGPTGSNVGDIVIAVLS